MDVEWAEDKDALLVVRSGEGWRAQKQKQGRRSTIPLNGSKLPSVLLKNRSSTQVSQGRKDEMCKSLVPPPVLTIP